MEEQETKEQTGWTIASLVLLVMNVIGFIVLAAMTLRTSAKFKEIFADLGAQLPHITQFLVSIPSTIYFVIFSGLIIALVLKEKIIRRKPLAFTINVAALIGGVACLVVYVTAMFMPLVQIIQTLEKTN